MIGGDVRQTWAGQDTVRVRGRWWMADRGLALAVELLAVLPVVAMVFEVAAAPRMQLLDYWSVLMRITNPDGTFNIGGVWGLQNEHPLVLPSFLYWLDASLFGGDNRVLGYLAVGFAAVTVLLLRSALPRTLPPVLRAGLVVAISGLVFALHGIHNFVVGMSGTAWLLANLLVITSLLLGRRRWWLAAWLVGILASASYGTGFAVWPALFLLAAMHRERWWRRITPLVIGAALVTVWLQLRPGVQGGGAEHDAGSLLYTFLTLLGHVWTGQSPDLAALAGGAVLAGFGALITVPWARSRGLWLWWALGLYAVLACGMIALARIDFGSDIGLASRYTSLSVLASVPLLVIAVAAGFRRARHLASRFAVVAVVVGLTGFALGSPIVTTVRGAVADEPLRAVAIRAQLDSRFWFGMPRTTVMAPRLAALDHYPFTDDFALGCGGPELGDRLDLDDMTGMKAPDPDRPTATGAIDSIEVRGDTSLFSGWAADGRKAVRCVLVVDATGEVTGGGQYHRPRPDLSRKLTWAPADTGFAVIAPTDPAGRVVVVLDGGRLLWLPAKVSGEG